MGAVFENGYRIWVGECAEDPGMFYGRMYSSAQDDSRYTLGG